MILAKLVLQRVQLIRRTQTFDRHDVGAVGPDGERQAGADAVAVHQDGAGAADAVLAADMGSGQPERVAQKIGQQQARLDARLRISVR